MSEIDNGGWESTRRPFDWDNPDTWEMAAEPEDSSTPEPAEATERSVFSRIITSEAAAFAGICAAIAVAAYAVADKGGAVAKSMKPKTPPAPLVASCPQPSDKAISTVERLFSEPVARARAEYRQLPLTGYAAEGDMLAPNLFGTNVPEIIYYAEDYFNRYGIDVEVASAPEQSVDGLRPPTTKELNSLDASNNLVGMIAALSEVAPHYVLESGLKKIRLMAGHNNTEFAWEEPHTLDWNIDTQRQTPDAVPFEFGIALGHFTEDRMCQPEGTDTDPAFEATNDMPFTSPLAPAHTIYTNEKGKKLEPAATLDNYHIGKAKPASVKVIDERAADSLSVDKAEILALVATPELLSSAMSADHPILRAKVIETLAELYRTQPAVVRRLAVKAGLYPWGRKHVPAGNQHDQVYELPKY